MRKNEFQALEDFTNRFIGEWGPSEGHYFGLDFSYKGRIYRLHTGVMYQEPEFLPDGREVLFGLFLSDVSEDLFWSSDVKFTLLAQFATMEELLDSCIIDKRPFREVIMDDETEIIGMD